MILSFGVRLLLFCFFGILVLLIFLRFVFQDFIKEVI